MKRLLAAYPILFFLFLSCGSTTQSPICDAEGTLLPEETSLLKAFNSLSATKAQRIGFSYDENSKIHYLLFKLETGEAVAYELVASEDATTYTLGSAATTVSHSRSGSPFNTCAIASTFETAVTCNCEEEDCTNCRCNHTVTRGTGDYPSTKKLKAAIEKLK